MPHVKRKSGVGMLALDTFRQELPKMPLRPPAWDSLRPNAPPGRAPPGRAPPGRAPPTDPRAPPTAPA